MAVNLRVVEVSEIYRITQIIADTDIYYACTLDIMSKKGWSENQRPIITKKGVENKAPRHYEVAVKKKLEDTLSAPMTMKEKPFIQERLLSRIDEKMQRLNSARPLSSDVLKKLHEEMRVLHTYHSNAIEGNTLTLSETQLVLEEGITIGGKTLREHFEATNNAKAFDLMENMAKNKRMIDHITIQEIHGVVMAGILEEAGRYRTKNVRITGATKTPPDWTKVVGLIDNLIKEIAESKRHPVETAALLHYRFVEMHPFVDGNGRVARLITNLYLISHGYPPIVLKIEDRMRYYRVLRDTNVGNLTPFVNFIAKAVDEGLTTYLSVFGRDDELLPLKELVKDAPYSQEYLSLRARQGVLDAVKIGKVWYSSRNAIKKMRQTGAH